MRLAELSIKSLLLPAKNNKIKRLLIVVIILMVQFLHSTATATDTRITTYYWDSGWVEHASWVTTTLGESLNIYIDAWNWWPEFSPLHVKFDNVITGDGLLDDFDDGTINSSIWVMNTSEGATVQETSGVLDIDIPAGSTSTGGNRVGGLITWNYLLQGDCEVQVDFSLNPEYHAIPNTNAKLFLTDWMGNGIAISVRSGCYQSVDLHLGLLKIIAETTTDHLNGKLRITRTEITEPVEVEIDIKPGSCPNSIDPKADGVIPVAILTTADFDAITVDPETVALEGAGARGKGKSGRYGSMEDVDGDGDLDLVVQIENVIEWDPGATEATLTGETYDGIHIQGTDSVNIVPPE